jgi:CheY-like chemotaxis protein/DNA-binding transcriptional ArsR family regulator
MNSPLVIVIEDQVEVRENLMETLELADYRVLGAPDGHEGVKLVREHLPSLILCDVMMPKLDGYGVLELLNKEPKTAAIPFIFLTARAEREDLRRGMNLGAADYITKPFFQDELLRVVEQRIAKKNEIPATEVKEDYTPQFSESYTGVGVNQLLDSLGEGGRRRQYTDRASIYFSGDQPHSVFKVLSGRVRLYQETDFGKTLTIDSLGEGSWFGLEDIYGGGAHAVNASAYPDAEVLLVDKATFVDFIQRHPSVVLGHAKQLSQDLALRAEQLLQIAYFSVRKRIAEFLLRFAEQSEGEKEIIDLRREDIAEAVGTTPESVTRVLTEFRKEGLVELPSAGGIVVVEVNKLQEVPA